MVDYANTVTAFPQCLKLTLVVKDFLPTGPAETLIRGEAQAVKDLVKAQAYQ